MIEDRSYGKAELAMLYFPTATPRVALNRLVRWINRCPELKHRRASQVMPYSCLYLMV